MLLDVEVFRGTLELVDVWFVVGDVRLFVGIVAIAL